MYRRAWFLHGVQLHSPCLLQRPYLQGDAINLFLVEFEVVARIFFDALDEFPSDVPWAAQYFFKGHIDALFIVFGLVPGLKLQQVVQINFCVGFSIIRLLHSHLFCLCILEIGSVMQQQRRLLWSIV